MLQVAPSAYRRHAARRRNPDLRSNRDQRDDALMPQIEIERVWQANMRGYGADKVWRQLKREGVAVAAGCRESGFKRLKTGASRRS